MAAGTAGIVTVFRQQVADGGGTVGIGIDRGDTRWWRRNRSAKDPLVDKGTPDHRRCRRAVGGDLEHSGLRDETAALARGRKVHPPDRRAIDPTRGRVRRSVGAGEAVPWEGVEVGQHVVDHREVTGDDRGGTEVLVEKFPEIGPRFHEHRLADVGIQSVVPVRHLGIQKFIWHGLVDVLQLQPLIEKIFDKPATLRIRQHPIHLRGQHSLVPQTVGIGQVAECVIGNGVPEPQRQTGGDRMVVERSRFLAPKQEVGRAEGGRIGMPHGRRKGSLRRDSVFHQGNVPLDFGVPDRPAECPGQKVCQELTSGRLNVDLRRHREGKIAEQSPVALRRPLIDQWPFDFQPVDGNPRAFISSQLVGRFRDRLRLEADLVGLVQPHGRLVHSGRHRRGVKEPQESVFSPDRGDFRAIVGLDHVVTVGKAPDRTADSIVGRSGCGEEVAASVAVCGRRESHRTVAGEDVFPGDAVGSEFLGRKRLRTGPVFRDQRVDLHSLDEQALVPLKRVGEHTGRHDFSTFRGGRSGLRADRLIEGMLRCGEILRDLYR